MDQVIKAFLIGFASVITPFIEDVVYDTIPHGRILKMVDRFPKMECNISYDGCNKCFSTGPCTMMYCSDTSGDYCFKYKCPYEELPVRYTKEGPLRSPTNLVCGTNLNVTVGACYCKPEYSFRDSSTLKCVKTCPV